MSEPKSLVALYCLGALDIKVLGIAAGISLDGGGIGAVSCATGSGEMAVWNSVRKLTKIRLVSPSRLPGRLGPITARGQSALREVE